LFRNEISLHWQIDSLFLALLTLILHFRSVFLHIFKREILYQLIPIDPIAFQPATSAGIPIKYHVELNIQISQGSAAAHCGLVVDYVTPSSTVYLRIQGWKNYQNQSTFAHVINTDTGWAKKLRTSFFAI